MAIKRNRTLSKYMLLHNGNKLKKGYHNGTVEIWSAGSTVTYIVDTDVSYQEEVDNGATCLAPTTFTPEKVEWIFTGWREDNVAIGEVLSEKIMDSDPITLYALFNQLITLSYVGNGSTEGTVESQTDDRFYNNGNITDPSFVIAENGFIRDGYTYQHWALGSVDGYKYTAGDVITLDANAILYAIWKRDTTVLFDTNDSTSQYYWGGMENQVYAAEDGYSTTWYTMNALNNGISNDSWAKIDCTDYTTCTIRVKGNITSNPQGTTAPHAYLRLSFTGDYENAVTLVEKVGYGEWGYDDTGAWVYLHKGWNQSGVAYDTWYDLKIDVSALTGVQTLKAYIGGNNSNHNGYLHCSKITMSSD